MKKTVHEASSKSGSQAVLRQIQRHIRVLGVILNPLTMSELTALVEQSIECGDRHIFANHNLHSVYLFHHNAPMRQFYRLAYCTYVEGMGLLILARLCGHRLRRTNRVANLDWLGPLMQLAYKRHWRVFFLGAEPGVGDKAAENLRARFPGLQVKAEHGFFDRNSEENEQVLGRIRAYKPHILIIGLGMPLQEGWIVKNWERIEANTIFNAGNLVRFVAGVVPTPPRWTGQLGIEWLYRLVSEPRKLWRRYLVEPFVLLLGLALRRFREDGYNDPSQ
jgi:N-acetylglucosaminyldiphosphoundecaprenol N-acetyl-beta-D-mannosaminyltransferase